MWGVKIDSEADEVYQKCVLEAVEKAKQRSGRSNRVEPIRREKPEKSLLIRKSSVREMAKAYDDLSSRRGHEEGLRGADQEEATETDAAGQEEALTACGHHSRRRYLVH